jgi:hypothetical protein
VDASRLAVDLLGNAILAGTFDSSVNVGGGAFTSGGNANAFVAKFKF